jgi:hypothetical protein
MWFLTQLSRHSAVRLPPAAVEIAGSRQIFSDMEERARKCYALASLQSPIAYVFRKALYLCCSMLRLMLRVFFFFYCFHPPREPAISPAAGETFGGGLSSEESR